MRESKNVAVIKSSWLIFLFLLLTFTADASTQATLIQVVNAARTVTLLQQPPESLFASSGFPFVINVTSSNGLVVSTGKVTLTDNSTLIGSAPVNNGKATVTPSVPSTGGHLLVACYAGSTNFLSSCSAPLTISTLAPYLLKQTNPSGTIDAPKAFVDNLKVVSTKGFSGVVRLNCQVSSYSCNISPSSLSFSGDGNVQSVKASFSPVAASTPVELSGIPIIGFLGWLIKRRRHRGSHLWLLLCSAALLCVLGCGPVISIPVNSANQTMIVNSASGSYSQTVTYQIQVESDVVQ
jgi:Bacterial Ig-like domain (group 3)